MDEMKEITMPSGAILKVASAPFSDSKALYQALLKEGKGISLNSKMEWTELLKDVICTAFSSPEVEACLKPCLARCLYGALKIDDKTFEPVKARQDYMSVCIEVAMENVAPFTKDLSALLKRISAMIESAPALRS